MKLQFLITALLAPQLSHALIGNNWSFAKDTSGGLKEVTFGFNVRNAPHESGYYFAQQFNFNNVSNVGYTGLQPRPDRNGKAILHAAFSSFQKGTTTVHPNCHNGADGGSGVSCAVEWIADYSHTYNCVVENISGTTWRGTVVDTVTGEKYVVGIWTLPAGAGGIKKSQVGFVEYYPWNSGSHECSDLPKTEVTFFDPTSTTSGAGAGTVSNIHEYGDCVGDVAYKTTKVAGGYDISCGFEQ